MTPHHQSDYSEEQGDGGTEPGTILYFSSYQEICHDVTLRLSYTGWRSSDTGSVLHSLGTRLPRDQVISEWLTFLWYCQIII